MSPATACNVLPTSCTIPTAATVHADWLIVATLPSYHGSIPYGLVYHACTKPTGSAYTVLACSRLRGKAIGIQVCFRCHHSRFEWPDRLTSLAPSCRPCPNDFLMVFMFWSVHHPLPCLFGWLLLSLNLLVISPISLVQSCCLRILRIWLVHPVSSRGFSTTGTGSTPRPVGISPYLVPPVHVAYVASELHQRGVTQFQQCQSVFTPLESRFGALPCFQVASLPPVPSLHEGL